MTDKRTFLKNVLLAAIPTAFATRLVARTADDDAQNRIMAIQSDKMERLTWSAAADGRAGLMEVGRVPSSKVAVYLSGDQLIPSSASTILAFDKKDADFLNEYSPGSGSFTALHEGIYQVSFCVRIENAAASTQSIAQIRKSGLLGTWIEAGSSNQAINNGIHYLTASGNLTLAKGDSIDLILTHFHSSPKKVRGRLSINRLT